MHNARAHARWVWGKHSSGSAHDILYTICECEDSVVDVNRRCGAPIGSWSRRARESDAAECDEDSDLILMWRLQWGEERKEEEEEETDEEVSERSTCRCAGGGDDAKRSRRQSSRRAAPERRHRHYWLLDDVVGTRLGRRVRAGAVSRLRRARRLGRHAGWHGARHLVVTSAVHWAAVAIACA